MRIICHHCETPAVIATTSRITPKFATLYTRCPQCGSRWAMTLEVSHEIPQKNQAEHLANIVEKLSPIEKEAFPAHLNK